MTFSGRWLGALKNRRDCRAKRTFSAQGKAEATIRGEAWMRNGAKFRAYKCTWCDGWHITTTRPARSRARGKEGTK